jgi:hypothetical protein
MTTTPATVPATATLLTTAGRSLTVEPLAAGVGEYLGCPGATVRLSGTGWEMLGTLEALRTVKRVPGWSIGGTRVRFTPAVLDPATGTDVVEGYMRQDALA